jgi:signal transduction histidine kinase
VRGSLNKRMLVASALIAVLISATFAFALVAISAERTSERLVEGQSQRELTLLNEINTLVVDLETGVQGFVITGGDRFLEPWLQARATLPARGAELVRLTDDPVEDPLAREIVTAVESYVEDYATPVVEAVRRNDPSASTVAVTEAGRQRIDAIRAQIDRYRQIEESALEQRQQDANVAARRAIAVAAGGLVASLLLIAGFAAYLARAIVSPVRRAAAMAERLADGELSARLPASGVGEIGSLERSFNDMASSLDTQQRELVRRAEEQAALRRVATLVAHGASPNAVLDAVAGEVNIMLDGDVTMLLRYRSDGTATVVAVCDKADVGVPVGQQLSLEDDSVAATVLTTGQAASIEYDDATGPVAQQMRTWGFHAATGTPVVTEDRLWGVAATAWLAPDGAVAGRQGRVAELTELLAVAIANADSQAELDASRARVVAASDQARRRIERDLHDGTQQRLVSLGLDVQTAGAMVSADRPDLAATLAQLGDGLSAALKDLQELTRGIHPAILSSGGLGPALRAVARRSPVPVELTVDGDRRLPEPVEVTVYYVVSEALANAAKHANASAVHVDLAVHDSAVVVAVRDDGDGGADPAHGSGLIGLRDRAEALGGRLEITSPPHVGTTLTVRIPVPPP